MGVVGVAAIVLGILIGMLMPWRRMRPAPVPVNTEEAPPVDN